MVLFLPGDYGPEVAALLLEAGGGNRPMPLVHTPRPNGEGDGCAALKAHSAAELFAGARSPETAMAGLYLYFSCWDEAHAAADAVNNREGNYWHGIVHRQEPDPENAGYWFRLASPHAIHPTLREEAAKSGYDGGAEWDPFEFIAFCELARRRPGSEEEVVAMKVQLIEWQLLFDFCAQRRAG
jgi:hypothetical protein